MITRNLIGIINQLTIFGQIEFINNNEYDVTIKGDVIMVSGVFSVVGTDDTEQLQIEITKEQYINHSKP
jgi:PKD repeat protein